MENVRFKLRISQTRKLAAKNSPNNSYRQNYRETTNFGVEVTNSKAQVKGKFGHLVQIQICRLPWMWLWISLLLRTNRRWVNRLVTHMYTGVTFSRNCGVASKGQWKRKMFFSTELIKSNYNPEEIEKLRFWLPVMPWPSSAFFSWQCMASSVNNGNRV